VIKIHTIFITPKFEITIKCAFGMLVHRFGVLHKPFPNVISMRQIIALTMCLCRLHNFCIDNNNEVIPISKYSDVLAISLDGGIVEPDQESQQNKDFDYRPTDLLDGGNHQLDNDRHVVRNIARQYGNQPLPRDLMLKKYKTKI
jgi:hypothetical protein